MKKLTIVQDCVIIHYDSQRVTHLVDHQLCQEKIKHINVRLHFMRDFVESTKVINVKIAPKENLIYMFIKSMSRLRLKRCLK